MFVGGGGCFLSESFLRIRFGGFIYVTRKGFVLTTLCTPNWHIFWKLIVDEISIKINWLKSELGSDISYQKLY